jgi:hypothetical protein
MDLDTTISSIEVDANGDDGQPPPPPAAAVAAPLANGLDEAMPQHNPSVGSATLPLQAPAIAPTANAPVGNRANLPVSPTPQPPLITPATDAGMPPALPITEPVATGQDNSLDRTRSPRRGREPAEAELEKSVKRQLESLEQSASKKTAKSVRFKDDPEPPPHQQEPEDTPGAASSGQPLLPLAESQPQPASQPAASQPAASTERTDSPGVDPDATLEYKDDSVDGDQTLPYDDPPAKQHYSRGKLVVNMVAQQNFLTEWTDEEDEISAMFNDLQDDFPRFNGLPQQVSWLVDVASNEIFRVDDSTGLLTDADMA